VVWQLGRGRHQSRPSIDGDCYPVQADGLDADARIVEGPDIETCDVAAMARLGPTFRVPRNKERRALGSYVFHGDGFGEYLLCRTVRGRTSGGCS